ncbi:MAG: YdcF family protein [Leptospirales bacterium]|nr:YdcF family protein [Leptospirales bacterium]
MFFYLSKIFSGLLFPYALFLLLSIVAAIKLPRSRFRLVFRLALVAIFLLSTNRISGALIAPLESAYPQMRSADAPQADAIVVLGGMSDPLSARLEGPEFLDSVDRILAAELLWRAGKAPLLVISGGLGLMLQRGEPEARALQRWLLARGIPQSAIVIGDRSRNTAENAIETAALARSRGWTRVLLVTSAFHLPRATLCFRKQGLAVIPFPTDYYRSVVDPGPEGIMPAPGAMSLSTVAIKEYLGIVAYWLRGYI